MLQDNSNSKRNLVILLMSFVLLSGFFISNSAMTEEKKHMVTIPLLVGGMKAQVDAQEVSNTLDGVVNDIKSGRLQRAIFTDPNSPLVKLGKSVPADRINSFVTFVLLEARNQNEAFKYLNLSTLRKAYNNPNTQKERNHLANQMHEEMMRIYKQGGGNKNIRRYASFVRKKTTPPSTPITQKDTVHGFKGVRRVASN